MKFTEEKDFKDPKDKIEFKNLCVKNTDYVIKLILTIIKERDGLREKVED